MKRFSFILLCVCAFLYTTAQDNILTDDVIYNSAEVMPQFEGGEKAMLNFIGQHLQYPEAALKSGIQGKCVLRFVITKAGEVGEVKVLRSVSEECDAEAIRVVRLLKFKPGMQAGKPVDVWYALPIAFRITEPNPNVPQLIEDEDGVTHECKMPYFPGGEKALMLFIAENLEYPENAVLMKLQGKCVVEFMVTATGDVKSIKVVSTPHPILNQPVIKVIESLPKFIPGTEDGIPVDVKYPLPVTFSIPQE